MKYFQRTYETNKLVKYIGKRVSNMSSNAEFYTRYNELTIFHIFTAKILVYVSSQFKNEIRFILIKNINLKLEC